MTTPDPPTAPDLGEPLDLAASPDAPDPNASPDAPDRVDEMLEYWEREVPGLDPLVEGIVTRIHKLARGLESSMEASLAQARLDRRAYQLISRLRASGPPYRLSAGGLADDLGLSSGAMTSRLDRLETAGMVRRLPDPDDRRGVLVEPTPAGQAAWDQAVGTQARREILIAEQLTVEEREELHRLLRRLMRAFPSRSGGSSRRPSAFADGETGATD